MKEEKVPTEEVVESPVAEELTTGQPVDAPEITNLEELLEMCFSGIHAITANRIRFTRLFGGNMVKEACFTMIMRHWAAAQEAMMKQMEAKAANTTSTGDPTPYLEAQENEQEEQ